MIKTKLHILASNVDPHTMQMGRDNKIIKQMLAAASFIIDKDVLELVQRPDCKKSVDALAEAGLVRLPFNPMVIEFEVDPNSHEFCYLHETPDGKIYGRPIVLDLKTDTAICANFELTAMVRGGKIWVDTKEYAGQNSPEAKIFLNAFAVSIHLALLMLNTKGIEKEVVHVSESLNKKRVARGKPAIPHHSIVHIGTIYRRDGSAIKRGDGGWHMPMHWRCAYTRRQHYGRGRKEEKLVFIPACIVNFKPEEAAPQAPHRDVKV